MGDLANKPQQRRREMRERRRAGVHFLAGLVRFFSLCCFALGGLGLVLLVVEPTKSYPVFFAWMCLTLIFSAVPGMLICRIADVIADISELLER